MIPHRISVSGFFSFKDPQELDFDGSPLWMLTGKNGSGKSTIFDAVTYTLFGYHRGGSQMAVELINKDSKGLSVEFDFWIDKNLYQARRTLRRNPKGSASGTQQLSRWELDSTSGQAHWVPIADTSKRVDFERWIEEHIGLNYETFTSSVLLLQGRAEKLLDSKPSGRAEVLAGIVDLKRYQLLHEKADLIRKDFKNKLESVQSQLEALGDVSPLELALAEEKIEQTEAALLAGRQAVEQLQQLEFQARGWRELRIRLAGKREKLAQAEALLGDALVIEKDYRRLLELREVLPHINAIQQLQAAIEESDSRTLNLLQRSEEVSKRKLELEHAHELGRKKRTSLQETLAGDEKRQRTVESQLRELEGILARVRLYEEQQGKLEKLKSDLKLLPQAPEEAVRTAQKALDEHNELGKLVPVLERFARHRQALSESQKLKTDADKETLSIKQKGEKANKELAALKVEGKTAEQARQLADQQLTEAKTILQQVRTSLKEFKTLKGAKTCSQCGQKLTAKHFEEEIERRESEIKTADTAYQTKTAEQAAAVKLDEELRQAIQTAEQKLADLRSKYKDHENAAKQAEKEIERSKEECRRAYGELSESFRLLISPTRDADWPSTTYPTADDLRKLQRDAGDIEVIKRRLREAQEVYQRHANITAQAATTQESLEKLKLDLPPEDPATLRTKQSGLQAEEKSLTKSLQATRRSLQENEGELDRLGRELDGIKQDLSACHNQLSMEETRRKADQESIERTLKVLPESWRQVAATAGLTDQHRWKIERDDLMNKGAESRYQQLNQARGGLDSLREEIKEAEAVEAGYTPEARLETEEVHALLDQAKQSLGEKEKAFQIARDEKGILDQNRKRLDDLRKTKLEHDRELKYYKLLAETLGRDRLQLFLLRTAERQIVDHANAVLDRLSEGQLYLTLRAGPEGTSTDSALDMEAYNRTTGEKPINVAFLSGSQRFRVAVSLALGIGQYASRQHRPIESVIIDEGFGCLDRDGRQVMIQELQNLRSQLQCILLVSHQEEFADAFNNGYRFDLQDGATKVTRFQR